jgi:hypothetical protein
VFWFSFGVSLLVFGLILIPRCAGGDSTFGGTPGGDVSLKHGCFRGFEGLKCSFSECLWSV